MILQQRHKEGIIGRPKTLNLMLIELKQAWQLCSVMKENNTI